MTLFVVTPYDSDLMHHGIKGQKWGVRRYQNKDGSLTNQGKARYHEGENRNRDESDFWEEKDLKMYGISHKDVDTDTIKAGAIFNRVTVEDEPLDSKRKYVSITKDDGSTYESLWNSLYNNSDPDRIATISYQSTKEIKVATTKKVLEEVNKLFGTDKVMSVDLGPSSSFSYGQKMVSKFMKKYGDRSISDFSLDAEENYKNVYTKKENKKKSFSGKFGTEIGSNIVASHFDKVIMDEKRAQKLMDVMKKQGYDAMIDINDIGYQYPLILISPDKSVKQMKVKRLDE